MNQSIRQHVRRRQARRVRSRVQRVIRIGLFLAGITLALTALGVGQYWLLRAF